MLTWISLFLYLLIVVSLIWGRLFFFKISGGTPKILAYSYDLAVVCQMLLTTYGFIYVTDVTKPYSFFVPILYLASLVIFWRSVVTAKSLDFAFSNKVGDIVTTGPFGIFRHPFYVSYLIAWWASTILFNSLLMWITALYLTAFYVISARKEERTILASAQAKQYQLYQQNVGMFLPRIKKWKQSSSEL
ncbi:MAG: methyltransferase [Pseudohongiella sp.]|nr:methyltransferase [Pseudohongiella sp.]MDO9518634.1 methyltransferase [Pseudohongiella sp.]MDP2128408.1 methyltransferase [Pseudohongiella sp.]